MCCNCFHFLRISAIFIAIQTQCINKNEKRRKLLSHSRHATVRKGVGPAVEINCPVVVDLPSSVFADNSFYDHKSWVAAATVEVVH